MMEINTAAFYTQNIPSTDYPNNFKIKNLIFFIRTCCQKSKKCSRFFSHITIPPIDILKKTKIKHHLLLYHSIPTDDDENIGEDVVLAIYTGNMSAHSEEDW